jgi:hypothetical protein
MRKVRPVRDARKLDALADERFEDADELLAAITEWSRKTLGLEVRSEESEQTIAWYRNAAEQCRVARQEWKAGIRRDLEVASKALDAVKALLARSEQSESWLKTNVPESPHFAHSLKLTCQHLSRQLDAPKREQTAAFVHYLWHADDHRTPDRLTAATVLAGLLKTAPLRAAIRRHGGTATLAIGIDVQRKVVSQAMDRVGITRE